MDHLIELAVEAYHAGDRDFAHTLFDEFAEKSALPRSQESTSGVLNRPQVGLPRVPQGDAGPQYTEELRDPQIQRVEDDERRLTAPSPAPAFPGNEVTGTSTSADVDDWDFPDATAGLVEDRGLDVVAGTGEKGDAKLEVSLLTDPDRLVKRGVRESFSMDLVALSFNDKHYSEEGEDDYKPDSDLDNGRPNLEDELGPNSEDVDVLDEGLDQDSADVDEENEDDDQTIEEYDGGEDLDDDA